MLIIRLVGINLLQGKEREILVALRSKFSFLLVAESGRLLTRVVETDLFLCRARLARLQLNFAWKIAKLKNPGFCWMSEIHEFRDCEPFSRSNFRVFEFSSFELGLSNTRIL